MKVLITGASGFIGKNLSARLANIRDGKGRTVTFAGGLTLLEYDTGTDPALLEDYCREADFVFHLAGVNRPTDPAEFMQGNFGFTSRLLDTLARQRNLCPVMLASSIQAGQDNPYGQSKKAGEDALFAYSEKTGAPVYIYRFPNVFGKWCRPNYNSVIATFCYNIARGLPIVVNDPDHRLTLLYIDDLVEELLRALQGHPTRDGRFCKAPVTHTATLGELAGAIRSFRESRRNLLVPDMTPGGLTQKLYATYLSYLPQEEFAYPLKMNVDERGSFTEILRTADRGQFSVNITKPGIAKGNHWHDTKNEKFLVVSGQGVIRFRLPGSDEVIEYPVSGDYLQVVDIPVGYTHNIENTGDTDLVTFMWCSECFDPQRPDTYFLEV